jgi:hypothetical protein
MRTTNMTASDDVRHALMNLGFKYEEFTNLDEPAAYTLFKREDEIFIICTHYTKLKEHNEHPNKSIDDFLAEHKEIA